MQGTGYIFHIPRIDFSKLLFIPKINLEKAFVYSKTDITLWIYYSTVIFAFYASINPWFLWRIYHVYPIIALIPVVVSLLLSRTLRNPIFSRTDYIIPYTSFLLMMFTITLVNGRNVNGYLLQIINSVFFLSLFRLNERHLLHLGTILCKTMAVLLIVSISFHFLYILGFHLPNRHIVNEEFHYSYTNYYFFLLDDRQTFSFLPRFNSVFLEPAHLGMTCICLLYSQIGNWRKWYNIVLFFTIVITFSLASWVFLVILLFSASWMKGKNITGKLLLLLSICAIVAIGSINYNRGDNVVNQLIVQRLTINEDGELEGDNRASTIFKKEFDKLASSEKILVGAGYDGIKKFSTEGGNAGYRVYIYSNGLISVFFLIIFLCSIAYTGTGGWRNKVVMLTAHFISFIPGATPLKLAMFIPWYILLFVKAKKERQ